MHRLEEAFNQSGLSRFLNRPSGRIFRVVMGIVFLIVGLIYREHALGVASIVWSVFPLSAGAFDICWISVALGGPLSGPKIRAKYQAG